MGTLRVSLVITKEMYEALQASAGPSRDREAVARSMADLMREGTARELARRGHGIIPGCTQPEPSPLPQLGDLTLKVHAHADDDD